MSQTSISTASNVCRSVGIASRRQDLNIREITFPYRGCVLMSTVAECAKAAPALLRMKTDPPDLNSGEMVLVMGVLANPEKHDPQGILISLSVERRHERFIPLERCLPQI